MFSVRFDYIFNNYPRMSQLKEGLNEILIWLHQQKEKYPTLTRNWWLRYPQEKYVKPYLKPKLSSWF
jgi:hypothetical protein